MTLQSHTLHDYFHRTGVVLHIISGRLSGLLQISLIAQEAVHQLFEIFVTIDFKATLLFQQMLGLAELLVVRTEDYGNAIDGCFQYIVNAYSETTTDVRNLALSIN